MSVECCPIIIELGRINLIGQTHSDWNESTPMTSQTRLSQRLVPALLVRDMAETLEFYGRLGFKLTGCHPIGKPTWAEVCRDSVTLQFHTQPPRGTPTTPVFSGTLYVFPESVTALADEYHGKVEFAWGPEVMDYGMREFAVQDPNGYFLAFSEPA